MANRDIEFGGFPPNKWGDYVGPQDPVISEVAPEPVVAEVVSEPTPEPTPVEPTPES